MDSKEYVLCHKFGYGENCESNKVNKLTLRNKDDLDIYIQNVLLDVWGGKQNSDKIELVDGKKIKVVISKV